MGAFDRFRRLERSRREHAGDAPPPRETLDRFRDPTPPLAEEGAAWLTKPCVKCGAENGALAERCTQCDADLGTDEMRAHRAVQRTREREMRERAAEPRVEREREAEEALERARAGRQRRIETAASDEGKERIGDLDWSRPLVALLRATRWIRSPWLRLGAQLGLVGGFVAAIFWSLLGSQRYPIIVLFLLLLGVAPSWRRRWWR
jgi:ribosomal protein L40E